MLHQYAMLEIIEFFAVSIFQLDGFCAHYAINMQNCFNVKAPKRFIEMETAILWPHFWTYLVLLDFFLLRYATNCLFLVQI